MRLIEPKIGQLKICPSESFHFEFVEFRHISRNWNRCALLIAKFSFDHEGNFEWNANFLD